MSNSVIGALRVMLGMDTAEFEDGATRAERAANRMERNLGKTAERMQKIGVTLTAALTAPLAAFAVKGISEARETAAAMAQVESALASMGPVAGRTAEQLVAAAEAFEGKSLLEADVILKDITANMLTFGNIAGEQFDRAQQAAIDMAERLDKGPREAAVMVGKALNDPIKGIAALGEAGVQFSDKQKAMIQSLVETGNTAAAQGIILGELERQFKGAAEAAQNADPFNAFGDALNNLAEAVGQKILPRLIPIIDWLTGVVHWFGSLPEPVQNAAIAIGAIAIAAGPVLTVLGSLVKVATSAGAMFRALKVAFDIAGLLKNLIPMIASLGRVLLALVASNPLLAALAVAIGLAFAAWQNWDKIEPIIRRLYEGVKKWLMDKLGPIFEWVGKKIEQVTGFFYNMYDAVVGNSYVPDMVDGIAAEFAKLQTLMVDPAEKAATSTKDAFRAMATEVMSLLDRLFPEIARARQMAADLDLLDKAQESGQISEELRRRARQRVLEGEYGGKAKTTFDDNPEGPLEAVDKVKAAVDGMIDTFDKGAKKTEVQTVRIAETVADMARNISGSIKGLVDGIKSGDFFSIFDAVLNVVTTLGGAGLFGSGFRDRINSTPGFANGGAMVLGGMAGIDRNILSLNGSPIARVSAGETMQIRRGGAAASGGVTNNYYTLPSDEFWNRVDGRAGNIVAAAAPSIARDGASQALGRLASARGRSLV